jgi:protocatechuate 3,4-dioxygenase beta subunit
MIGHRAGRRGLLACLGFLGIAGRATAAILTPEQTARPFYPPPNPRPQDTDWDLVKIEGRVREAGGEIMHLSGRVLDRGARRRRTHWSRSGSVTPTVATPRWRPFPGTGAR